MIWYENSSLADFDCKEIDGKWWRRRLGADSYQFAEEILVLSLEELVDPVRLLSGFMVIGPSR
jgi:hypothetical protein